MPVRLRFVALCLAVLAGLGLLATVAGVDLTAMWAAFGLLGAGAGLVGANRGRSKINI